MTHVSLIQRDAATDEPPALAAVRFVLMLPYTLPNIVMPVWPVRGAVLGQILLTTTATNAGKEILVCISKGVPLAYKWTRQQRRILEC